MEGIHGHLVREAVHREQPLDERWQPLAGRRYVERLHEPRAGLHLCLRHLLRCHLVAHFHWQHWRLKEVEDDRPARRVHRLAHHPLLRSQRLDVLLLRVVVLVHHCAVRQLAHRLEHNQVAPFVLQVELRPRPVDEVALPRRAFLPDLARLCIPSQVEPLPIAAHRALRGRAVLAVQGDGASRGGRGVRLGIEQSPANRVVSEESVVLGVPRSTLILPDGGRYLFVCRGRLGELEKGLRPFRWIQLVVAVAVVLLDNVENALSPPSLFCLLAVG